MMRYLIKMMAFLFCLREGRRVMLHVFFLLALPVLFWHFGPQPFRMSPFQTHIGNELVKKAVSRFPWSAQVGSVLMISEEEAWAPFFQDAIRARVRDFKSDGSRKFDILPDSFAARLTKALGFKNTAGVLTEARIGEILRTMPADTLLLVRFARSDYVEDAQKAHGRLSCVFYAKDGSEPICVDVSVEQRKPLNGVERMTLYFESMSDLHRLVWGVLGVLLFPFLMAPVTLTVTRMRSAKANGVMIFVYAVVLFAVEGVMFSAPEDFFEAVLACVWGVTIVWYLLKTCDLIASPGFRRCMRVFRKE